MKNFVDTQIKRFTLPEPDLYLAFPVFCISIYSYIHKYIFLISEPFITVDFLSSISTNAFNTTLSLLFFIFLSALFISAYAHKRELKYSYELLIMTRFFFNISIYTSIFLQILYNFNIIAYNVFTQSEFVLIATIFPITIFYFSISHMIFFEKD
jgi:hypothetical protein